MCSLDGLGNLLYKEILNFNPLITELTSLNNRLRKVERNNYILNSKIINKFRKTFGNN